jgi:hypothetical protein
LLGQVGAGGGQALGIERILSEKVFYFVYVSVSALLGGSVVNCLIRPTDELILEGS